MTYTDISKPAVRISPIINSADILMNLVDDTIDTYSNSIYANIEVPPSSTQFFPLFSEDRYVFTEDYYPFQETNYTESYYNDINKPSWS